MSDQSTLATSGDEPQAEAQPTAHRRFPSEWGDLVGFRRRESSPAAERQPGSAPAQHDQTRPDQTQPDQTRNDQTQHQAHVVVGKGACIVGEITNCSQVEIAGALEGKVVAEAVIVQPGGCLKGQVFSERAEVHGTVEGQMEVEDHLDIRSSGEVSGELVYGKLSVASGGRLSGSLQIVARARKKELPEPAAEARAWEPSYALVEETGSG